MPHSGHYYYDVYEANAFEFEKTSEIYVGIWYIRMLSMQCYYHIRQKSTIEELLRVSTHISNVHEKWWHRHKSMARKSEQICNAIEYQLRCENEGSAVCWNICYISHRIDVILALAVRTMWHCIKLQPLRRFTCVSAKLSHMKPLFSPFPNGSALYFSGKFRLKTRNSWWS